MKFLKVLLWFFVCVSGQNEDDVPLYLELNPNSDKHHDNPLMQLFDRSGLNKIIELFVPVVVRDFYKYFQGERPRKLDYDFELRHGSIQDVIDNYVNSRISSCKPEEYLTRTCACNETFEELNAIKSKSMYSQVAVAANIKLKKIVISYRETTNIQNVIDDFEINLIDAPSLPYGAQIHRGFYAYHLSLFKPATLLLERLLKKPKYENYTIQLTGFSLGAAAAVVSLPDWLTFLREHQFRHPVEIFTYSGPRAGNYAFADYINGLQLPITRYTNFNDVVPHLPPRAAQFGHVGVEIYQVSDKPSKYGNFTMMICKTDYDEDPNCAMRHKQPRSLARHLTVFNAPETRPVFC